MPLPLGVTFVAVADLVAFLVLLAGGAPSILATSSRLLLDPPLAMLDLPGPPGCLFPVISLLNGVVWYLKSMAQPVCDAVIPVICSCRTQYMYVAIFLVCSLALCKVIRVDTRTTNYKQSPTMVNIDRPAHIKTDKQCRTHTTSTARLPDD